MTTIKMFKKNEDFGSTTTKEDFVNFLYKHLGQYGDEKEAINNCLSYALTDDGSKGGFALASYINDDLVGALIMNKTGMKGYIPENILVYVAVDSNIRGKGIGRQICEKAIELADGDVKLHVEYENPAKRLYERIGFTSKYAEMRFSKGK